MNVFNDDDKHLAEQLFEHVRVDSASRGDGVTRASYSKQETNAAEVIAAAADILGLHTAFDDVANLVITNTPQRPKKAIWIGSHLDSVPNGGNYDGLAGVVAALLILGKAKAEGCTRPLVGLGLRGEESAWFGVPHLGAKAMLGKMKTADLDRYRGVTTLTVRQAMRDCQVSDMTLAMLEKGVGVVSAADIEAWWELHIEQGPSLEGANVPVGLVTSIAGSVRAPYAVMRGKMGHSGTTPHAKREDAVMRFVDLMGALESRRAALMMENRELRVTCGMVSTNKDRHSLTSIADEVTFSLDIRGDDLTLMMDMFQFAQMYAGDDLKLGELVSTKPCALSPDTYLATTVACRDLGIKSITLPSGAGHDATVFDAANIKAGMLFVRNYNGSHNPAESMRLEDFMLGLEVLYRVVTC